MSPCWGEWLALHRHVIEKHLVREERWRGFHFENKALLYLSDLNPTGSCDDVCKNGLLFIQCYFSSQQGVHKKDRLVYQLSSINHMG